MATFDYVGTRAEADQLIKEFGMLAALRPFGATDNSQDRPCWVAIVDYLPSDKATQLTNPTDRQIVMSPVGLDDNPPNNENDQLVTFVQPPANPPVEHEVLPFTCPVKPTAPAGIVVLYQFTVRQ